MLPVVFAAETHRFEVTAVETPSTTASACAYGEAFGPACMPSANLLPIIVRDPSV